MATLEGEGLHKPQDIMVSSWATLQQYNQESEDHHFDIDYQSLSLLLREAAILYNPQCAKAKLYPTIQPYHIPVPPVTATTPVVSVPVQLRSVEVATQEDDPYYDSAEGNRSVTQGGPTHTFTTTTGSDYREYNTSAVPLRRKDNKLPFSVTACETAFKMSGNRQDSSWIGIEPATRLDIKKREIKNGFVVSTLRFEVPLDHHSSQENTLKLHAELVDSYSDSQSPPAQPSSPISTKKPFILYLCGGPGDGNPSERVPELNKFCLDRGYQVLYVHYRGTGRSPLFSDSPLSTNHKDKVLKMSDQDKANYLAKFRQDNIVRDLEAIRLCLEKKLATKIKWTLIGQSFGGWISTTYLSFLPSSLEAVYISAGIPPLGKTPRKVYEKTYNRIVRRNEDYFTEYFPDDEPYVRIIVKHLRDEAPPQKSVDGKTEFRGYPLDAADSDRKGSYLTYQTFMTLGRTFGSAPVVNRDNHEDNEMPSMTSSIGALTIKHSKSSLESSVTRTTATELSTSYRSSAASINTLSSLSSVPESTPEVVIPPAYAKLHNLIDRLITDLRSISHVSEATLALYTQLESFALHRRPLYALLHEAIYCSSTSPATSQPSSWAATKVALAHPSNGFSWLDPNPSASTGKDKYYFTGETLHPPYLLSALGGDALQPWLGAAELLAQKKDWPALYDLDSLAKNGTREGKEKVKVRAVAYKEDMYVDLELSRQAAGMAGGWCELVVCPYEVHVKGLGPNNETFKLLCKDGNIEVADKFHVPRMYSHDDHIELNKLEGLSHWPQAEMDGFLFRRGDSFTEDATSARLG
ncbi:hypothetical protein B0T20DRAFT_505079 [Sordaria brevicollis]|uniref:AB hydrolase-1 domain-containing protein n=1 Tax=Sordaria brevicollis TaxID=83679 RepID=A0AAE0PJ02_SORBR|nr:hypothetical protein B0T20DRAFT_505079 [Sordaria brevicollis]